MNGVLNIYKPQGITSFDVVRKIKKIAKVKKVGHTGTLDPMATGVLPICMGNGTKIVDYIMNENKIYKAELKLGVVTDSYDREGKVLSESEVNVTKQQVIECINSFLGETEQVPPMYSALKVNGKRLYELARQGIEVERKKRRITIFSINILDINLPYVTFEVECSKGTYIRSLCYDIGEKLNTGATMWNLERIKTGAFNISNSVNLEDLIEDNLKQNLIPIDEALNKYDSVNIEERYLKLLLNGVNINNKYVLSKIKSDDILRVYVEDKFIGIGQRNKEGFKIIKLLV